MQENVNAICMLCAFLAGTRNKGRNNLIERGKGKEAWLISMHAKLDDEVVGPGEREGSFLRNSIFSTIPRKQSEKGSFHLTHQSR